MYVSYIWKWENIIYIYLTLSIYTVKEEETENLHMNEREKTRDGGTVLEWNRLNDENVSERERGGASDVQRWKHSM